MTPYLLGIAIFFQACSLLILTQSPWGAVSFTIATLIEGLILWMDRKKTDDLAEIKQKIAQCEASVTTLHTRVSNW